MPVHLDSHTPDPGVDAQQVKRNIIEILYDNPEYGYNSKEIGEMIGLPQRTVGTILGRLYDDGLIDKTQDGYYHALEDVDKGELDLGSDDIGSEDD